MNKSQADSGAPRRPELLAPAGDWECARAAVENGADAIYFGLEKFNARMRASNFTEADLPQLLEFLHRRGVKGYVTFNTLVFEDEMAAAEQYVRAMLAAGVDAVIVQDVGICRLIRQLSPDFPIHASTQMTITSPAGTSFARQVGCNLVVLARECSLKEIAHLVGHDSSPESSRGSACTPSGSPSPAPASLVGRGTPCAPSGSAFPEPPLPIEVFVHGALCVAYSGQCLTSEALGGRSANRGECAQACRLPYDLISDGQPVALGDRKYLLSPQDLAGLEVLPELVAAGVASLKIEGRLKSPEYVANITRIYRQALDRLASPPAAKRDTEKDELNGAVPDAPSPAAKASDPLAIPYYEMGMSFSRGLHTGWLRGTNNQQLVHGRFAKKRGVYVGEVAALEGQLVRLQLEGPLKPGDGVVFDAGHPEDDEEGGRVYSIEQRGGYACLGFGRGDVDFKRIHPGDKLWKTSDPQLERRLRQSFSGERPQFQRPLRMEVHGLAGQPLTLIARDELGHVARLESSMPLAQAQHQPLSIERLREQLGRLGGTPFELAELTSFLEGQVLLPISELNRLRRAVVSELETQRTQPKRWTFLPSPKAETAALSLATSEGERVGVRGPFSPPGSWFQCMRESESASPKPGPCATPRLHALVRTLPQLQAAIQAGVTTLYCDFEDPKKYREAVQLFRQSAARDSSSEIFVAPPRIFKTGEEWILKQVRSCEADGYLVRNYDHLDFFAGERRIGDYSFNIANRLAADYFKNTFSLERVTASYDLNFSQLEALLQAAPPEWFEVTVHQHIPMFHMEHCLFCAFLSSGTDYTNCGRPCDKHDVKLRDRVGAEHPLKADSGCRNTVFNALAQTGADYVARMLALGLGHFRVEFLNETPDQVTRTLSKYRRLLRGEITGPQLWRELKLLNQLGVTRGQISGRKGR
ncbi:Peptidase U32 [Verrucomicrobia bacterium]|nr:Peptidase U32 [Verrucomicrobiota bacterium]